MARRQAKAGDGAYFIGYFQCIRRVLSWMIKGLSNTSLAGRAFFRFQDRKHDIGFQRLIQNPPGILIVFPPGLGAPGWYRGFVFGESAVRNKRS